MQAWDLTLLLVDPGGDRLVRGVLGREPGDLGHVPSFCELQSLCL